MHILEVRGGGALLTRLVSQELRAAFRSNPVPAQGCLRWPTCRPWALTSVWLQSQHGIESTIQASCREDCWWKRTAATQCNNTERHCEGHTNARVTHHVLYLVMKQRIYSGLAEHCLGDCYPMHPSESQITKLSFQFCGRVHFQHHNTTQPL